MKKIVFGLLGLLTMSGFGQSNPFHTMTYPTSSPMVVEMQRLGVTEITISYHSPALRERDVWNNPDIIPQNGTPIAWRAGANMNTTIEFGTDVTVNDNTLKAGTYGFHVIPREDSYTLIFAHNSNQWGSYYLDMENDVALTIDVNSATCPNTEQLDFEFMDRKDDSVVVALEWGTKRLPFTVGVDLNKTVVESFRNELRGINTYRWEAWNDAANWCLEHDTNLGEALTWVNRSIDGGYNGFAANKNLSNLTTKARLLDKLGRDEELASTVSEASKLSAPAYDFNGFIIFLLRQKQYEQALAMSASSLEQHPDTWYLQLNKAISLYHTKKKSKEMFRLLDKAHKGAPDNFKSRIEEISGEVKNGTYGI